MSHRKAHTVEKGFTLVELAVVLIIIGFILSGALALLKPYLDSVRRNSTQEKLQNISLLLADFAQHHGRLPCPASPNEAVTTEPFGAPRGSGSNGQAVDSTCGGTITNVLGNFVGIVPFRALAIDRDAAKDAYGRYITYAVSPSIAGRDDNSQGSELTDVHIQCLQSYWLDEAATVNLNPKKALLCCTRKDANNNNDIIVRDAATGTPIFSGVHSPNPTDYQNMNTLAATTPTTDSTQFIAFVLISHGQNGRGAYTGVNTQQFAGTGPVSTDETENTDGDIDFVDRPLAMVQSVNYFDDIVLWNTNHQLVSAFGNDSCSRP